MTVTVKAIGDKFDSAKISYQQLRRIRAVAGQVVTEVAPAGDFWEAEPEHQRVGSAERA